MYIQILSGKIQATNVTFIGNRSDGRGWPGGSASRDIPSPHAAAGEWDGFPIIAISIHPLPLQLKPYSLSASLRRATSAGAISMTAVSAALFENVRTAKNAFIIVEGEDAARILY